LRGTRFKTVSRFARKWGKSASLDPRLQMVMDATYLAAGEKEMLYLPDVRDRVEGFDPAVRHMDCFESVKDADWLNQLLYLDTKIFMPTLNLTYNDKMSMAVSTEVRVPFLDKDLVEWVAWNIPPAWKMKRGEKKYIFRKAMAGMLPPEVLRQKKASFGAPVDYWLANDLREMVDDLRMRQGSGAGGFSERTRSGNGYASNGKDRGTGRCRSGSCSHSKYGCKRFCIADRYHCSCSSGVRRE